MRLIMRILQRKGYGFSPDGLTFGLAPMLGKLLNDVGCQNVQTRLTAIDYSYGAPLHESQCQNLLTALWVSRKVDDSGLRLP